jgi:hypothetical protein
MAFIDEKRYIMLVIRKTLFLIAALAAVTVSAVSGRDTSPQIMLILRGNANEENPRGQLDDEAALEYARRLGFMGDVLDVAGDADAGNRQVDQALERIRSDQSVTAIYGFSGGGYNARLIWKKLAPAEQKRIRMIVVIGSPGVARGDFSRDVDVLIRPDPPEGHMAGPKVLLESFDIDRGAAK